MQNHEHRYTSNEQEANQKLETLAHMSIKIKNKERILKELSVLGIHEASLFPEVDKVANFLKENI